MGRDLFVVESPAKAKKISKMFSHLEVLATVGHFRDLPEKEMGVEPPAFTPQYVIDDKKSAVVKRLRSAANSADTIFIATDPDREGEAIAMHVAQILGGKHKAKLRRVKYSEVSKASIEKAMRNSGAIDYALVRAQEARRVIDRFVGYLVSPVLTNKVSSPKFLSAGRVQSVALKLLAIRHNEIEAFQPQIYYTVTILLDGETSWKAAWDYKAVAADRKLTAERCLDPALAQEAAKLTQVTITEAETKDAKVAPPAPFVTSALLKAAAKRFKFSAKQTMKIAQSLFESGAITYHRTDSPVIDPDFVQEIRLFASEQGYPLPDKPITRRAKAGAQEAHEAIRVTDIRDYAGKFGPNDDETKLYQLIWFRTVQSQLAPGLDIRTCIKMTGSNAHPFVANGKQVKFLGWRCLNQQSSTSKESDDDNQVLPAVSVGQVIDVTDAKVEQKKTTPPALYTEESFIEELEKRGIGRPSTYASIIETLLNRTYVSKAKGKLVITELGIKVVVELDSEFGFMEITFTAQVEEYLDLIASGKARYLDLVESQYSQLNDDIKAYHPTYDPSKRSTAPRAQSNSKPATARYKAGDKCPKCSGQLMKKTIKGGKNEGKDFLGCTNFSKGNTSCDFFQWAQ